MVEWRERFDTVTQHPAVDTRRPLTDERMAEIRALAAGLRAEAEHDIEDKREMYNALMDLLTLSCYLEDE